MTARPRRRRRRRIPAGAAALAALSVLAGAGAQAGAQDGFYAGASVGFGKSAELCSPAVRRALGCNDRAVAGKAVIGVRFNRFLGAEIGFARTGAVRRSDALGKHRFVLRYSASLSGVFRAPVSSNFTPFVRLGFHHYRLSYKTAFAQLQTTVRGSENGESFLFGAGLEYRFNDRLSSRLEYEQLRLDYKRLPDDRLHIFSAAVLFHF